MSEKEPKEKEKVIKIEKSGSEEIPVEEVREILQVVSAEVPKLIQELFRSLYSAQNAQQYAEGIGTIYKTLSEQGLPPEMIEKLVMNYADSVNVIGKAMQGIEFDKVKTRKEEDED
ncbi:MAG: hypothetical protein GF308_17475 [Candidatus Heimdallarchaeota archaeon]|nr:hypothetical protein [Candidatus Heimdallarchaeota archaeon]